MLRCHTVLTEYKPRASLCLGRGHRDVRWFGTQSALRAAKERVTGGGASRRTSASFGERTGSRAGRSETPRILCAHRCRATALCFKTCGMWNSNWRGVSDASRQFVRGERSSGRSVVWNTERPSGGEGEGDGRGRFASDVSFLRRADGVPCGAERNSPDPLRSPLPRNGSVFHDGG